MGKGRAAFQFLLCHSYLKITTGMKDHGLIQLQTCEKAKDYCIQHGTPLVHMWHKYRSSVHTHAHTHTHANTSLLSPSWWRWKKILKIRMINESTWGWNYLFQRHFARIFLRNEASFASRACLVLPIGRRVCIKSCWQLWERVPTFIWRCLALQLTSLSPSPLADLPSLLIPVASPQPAGSCPRHVSQLSLKFYNFFFFDNFLVFFFYQRTFHLIPLNWDCRSCRGAHPGTLSQSINRFAERQETSCQCVYVCVSCTYYILSTWVNNEYIIILQGKS